MLSFYQGTAKALWGSHVGVAELKAALRSQKVTISKCLPCVQPVTRAKETEGVSWLLL